MEVCNVIPFFCLTMALHVYVPQKETAPGEEPCTDWWKCLQEIVQKEGPQALFKGSLLRVLRTSPQFGITLFLYGMLCDEP